MVLFGKSKVFTFHEVAKAVGVGVGVAGVVGVAKVVANVGSS